MVTTTSRLLNYHWAHQHLRWTSDSLGGQTRIHVHEIADPIFGKSAPTARRLQGITFYVPAAARADVFLAGRKVENLDRNANDFSGRPTVTIPWSRLQFPL